MITCFLGRGKYISTFIKIIYNLKWRKYKTSTCSCYQTTLAFTVTGAESPRSNARAGRFARGCLPRPKCFVGPAHPITFHPAHLILHCCPFRTPPLSRSPSPSPRRRPRRRLHRRSAPSPLQRPSHGGRIGHPLRPHRAPRLLLPRAPPPPRPPRRRSCLSPPRPVGAARIARSQGRFVRWVRVLAAERPLAELEQPPAQGDDPPRRLRLRALAHRHGVPHRPQANRGGDGRGLRQDPHCRRRKVCVCTGARYILLESRWTNWARKYSFCLFVQSRWINW